MSDEPAPGLKEFATTHWSMVLSATPDDASQTIARRALEKLCEAYWYPLYAFVRMRGHAEADAQDLTQSFFAHIITKGGFASADPTKGRFRSYLLTSIKNFMTQEWRRSQAKKRGGEMAFMELDALEPHRRYAMEPTQAAAPETVFDRKWARELVDRAMSRLRGEYEARQNQELFDVLKGCLTGQGPGRAEAAAQLGMTENAIKVNIHRLRQRYRIVLRSEVAETVAAPSDVDDEVRYLVSALRQK